MQTNSNQVTPSSEATPAKFEPEALDNAISDVGGMIRAAMRAAVSGDHDTDCIYYLLENADARLEDEVLPAIPRQPATAAPDSRFAQTVDRQRFEGALRILNDAIIAAETRCELVSVAAVRVALDALQDASDPAKIGN